MRRMYDAAYPPYLPPKWEIVAGYIGGNTPHIWTDDEWKLQIRLAEAIWILPIWACSFPANHDPLAHAKQVLAWLEERAAPLGICVGLDFETAVDSTYVRTFDKHLTYYGYKTLLYGSASSIYHNPEPSGGYWVADWTGVAHLLPGTSATQWSGSKPFGGAYDPSLVADSTTLWKVGNMSLSKEDLLAIKGLIRDEVLRATMFLAGRSNARYSVSIEELQDAKTIDDVLARLDEMSPPGSLP